MSRSESLCFGADELLRFHDLGTSHFFYRACWRAVCGLSEFPSVLLVCSLVGLSRSSSLVHSFDITNVMVCLVLDWGCKRRELKNLVGCKSV